MNIQTIPAKTIVSGYMTDGWLGAEYNMNIYKGCCHGCIYCDSRSECYGIEDFDTVRAKENAAAVIEKDLRAKRKTGLLYTGGMSDPYNPFEKKLGLTRAALELAAKYGFGIGIFTKSSLVLRDIDLMKKIKALAPVAVHMTITTADDALCGMIEPNVCPSSERFDALRELSANGIKCGVLLTPVLPFINDTEENILEIVRRAHDSGAKWVHAYASFGVTMRGNQRDYFYARLDKCFPGKKELYIKTFGETYYCISPENERLWRAFVKKCGELGLKYKNKDIAGLIKCDYENSQISLF